MGNLSEWTTLNYHRTLHNFWQGKAFIQPPLWCSIRLRGTCWRCAHPCPLVRCSSPPPSRRQAGSGRASQGRRGHGRSPGRGWYPPDERRAWKLHVNVVMGSDTEHSIQDRKLWVHYWKCDSLASQGSQWITSCWLYIFKILQMWCLHGLKFPAIWNAPHGVPPLGFFKIIWGPNGQSAIVLIFVDSWHPQ